MTLSEFTQKVTSFANMMLATERVRRTVSDTGEQYIGSLVTETFPNGQTADAMIMAIEWCDSCGIDGDFLIYIAYTDPQSPIPGAWVNKLVLMLKDE